MQKRVKINLQPLGKTISANVGTPLMDVLHEFGVEFPCGGKGTCGNCKVKLLQGSLSKNSVHEEKLRKLKLDESWRLACYCTAETDISLEISQFENIILADNTRFDFEPRQGFSIAVDLGTTTIVAQLINLETGRVLDSVSAVNPQAKFGGDLISRIQKSLEGNRVEMRDLVRSKIGQIIYSIISGNNIYVTHVSLVGNTAMHHIFSDIDVQPLSMYPFDSPNIQEQRFLPKELGWSDDGVGSVVFHESIGSFVGSDILAGIAATKLHEQKNYSILIDLGTNGELVIGNSERIICASTAAGPAFEGAKIHQGMRATTGAISSVDFVDGQLKNHVIGNVPAKGICGSGLIDIIAILLEQEKIGMFGEINSGEEKIELEPGVYLTQQDIREFQLAKAAISTGIQVLLNQLNITYKEIDKVYIAGGFGNFLNIKNVIRTGLIECEAEKIIKFGNTALIGAKMFLFRDSQFTGKIISKTKNVNLEGDPGFQDIYIEKMMLV